jgi:hypothetical protein
MVPSSDNRFASLNHRTGLTTAVSGLERMATSPADSFVSRLEREHAAAMADAMNARPIVVAEQIRIVGSPDVSRPSSSMRRTPGLYPGVLSISAPNRIGADVCG